MGGITIETLEKTKTNKRKRQRTSMKIPRTANSGSPVILPLRSALFTICNWDARPFIRTVIKTKALLYYITIYSYLHRVSFSIHSVFRSRHGAAVTPVEMKLCTGKWAWQISSFHMHSLVIKCNFDCRAKPQQIEHREILFLALILFLSKGSVTGHSHYYCATFPLFFQCKHSRWTSLKGWL